MTRTRVVYSYLMLDLRSKARQQLLAYYFTNRTARSARPVDRTIRLKVASVSESVKVSGPPRWSIPTAQVR